MFGPELVEAFRKFKALWDPEWKMNPGKVVLPNKLDSDLRLGAEYRPWQPDTHFRFPADDGSLAKATLRCVGVGKCRQYDGGVMCPSFRVTREEKHSTRGRAHLLWEMTNGGVIEGQWQDEDVKSSLDLCLSCKGCKSECPVAVDVATYKAEFLAHHFEKKRRPVAHHIFGRIDQWARLGSRAPRLANFITQTPGLDHIARTTAGISSKRRLPALARKNFQQWFKRRSRRAQAVGAAKVLLWPDTFNNFFYPETAIAAVEVLEAAGFEVVLPAGDVCCGRPLYDFGMLDRAKTLLQRALEILEPEIIEGTPVLVLEPSCASVFRDELLNLFPENEWAQKLVSQVFLLSEFLEKHASGFHLPEIARPALVHGHCHQKAIMKMTSQETVLKRLAIEYSMPAPGCCGMAGSFGFEKQTCDVSLAIGELELLPAVRQTPLDWLIIADGFSCREQIEQCTGRKTLHIAEVIRMGLPSVAEPAKSP
jgi:Fe-S oxidoreductase